jgi:transposase-like protein
MVRKDRSGRHVFLVKGEQHALLLCSDFESLDLVGYGLAKLENYGSWKKFLIGACGELTKSEIKKFFVTDGKRGLHQALSELFPNIPTQLRATHKQRRINMIVPRVRGDGYDKLYSHLAHRAIRAPIDAVSNSYPRMLADLKCGEEYSDYPKPRQQKLNRIIGALRFQKNKLHARYAIDEIDDPTTNQLEGINSFLQERIDLMRGFKKLENADLLIKLLIYYYRFHKFTSSGFKERNGKCPVELNIVKNRELLDKLLNGKLSYSWIRNLLSGT